MSGQETAYYNATVYTMDDKQPVAGAFTVKDGRFLSVGDDPIAGNCSERIDLGGCCVIPGLVDSHCHLLAGIKRYEYGVIYLPSDTLPPDLGEVLAEMIKEEDSPDVPVIAAMGIDLSLGEFCARDIDHVISDKPVLVFSGDGHALLMNSRAMERLGIGKDTADPGEHSFFKRYPDGTPTGLVIEIPAMKQCMGLMDENDTDFETVIAQLCRDCASYGYTTVFDASSVDDDDLSLFDQLKKSDEEGSLLMRIAASFRYTGEEDLSDAQVLEILHKLRSEYSSGRFFCNTLKLIADGTLEEHTALLRRPYCDTADVYGSRMISVCEMERIAKLSSDMGFNIHIHAIGDRAVGETLDILGNIKGCSGTRTIAHNQLYAPEDISRILSDKDIFFQTTPYWVIADEFTQRALGEDRYALQFPVATMIRNGVRVSFGSDSCLEETTVNPFLGMFMAVARGIKEYEGLCFPPPGEGIGRQDCLRAYTLNGAAQLGIAHETGSIEAGKSADFAVLDRDIMHCDMEELKDTKVLETFLSGKRTWIRQI